LDIETSIRVGAAPEPEATSAPNGGDAISSAAALSAALALTACGGGGTETAPTPSSPSSAITPGQASRFLAQSTMGATKTAIADVIAKGYEGWLTDQFALSRATTHWNWLVANGFNVAANINNQAGFDPTMWRQMIVEPDQLRQRVGMALLDLLVVGIGGINLNWRQFATAAYVDVLLDNAFGNYRTILEGITYNAAMASFLTYLGNRKANPARGSVPDENYARELMQLFTLGLSQLNMDGTVKTGSDGAPIDTYSQADITQLARVFTGLSLSTTVSTTPDRYRDKLVMNAALNETGSSTFLGTTVTGGGTAAITAALDTIFAHPNLPPFVSKQLIQRLVTSNPSPAYVGRVAAAFANSAGVRGDMKAVIRAILLDSEARGDPASAGQNAGKLREPVMRLTGWARAFGATSPSNAWAIGDTSSQANRLGQSKGRSPSVFNFFRPGYTPPNTAIATAGLVAPEFQITNEQTVIAYVNYMQSLIVNGTGDFRADYGAILALAGDSAALVDEVNLLIAAGQLSSATVSSIRAAVDSIAATGTAGPANRVYTAILLTLASPDYLTFR
jgi:uncharacterized protein (DUF1800 family)